MNNKNFEILSILNKKEISVLRNEIKRTYNFAGSDDNLDNYVINLYKKDPTKAGKAYDMLNQNLVIKRIFLNKKFERKLKGYFSQNDKNSTDLFSFSVFNNFTKFKRNNLGWHQDSAYFKEAKKKFYLCLLDANINGWKYSKWRTRNYR